MTSRSDRILDLVAYRERRRSVDQLERVRRMAEETQRLCPHSNLQPNGAGAFCPDCCKTWSALELALALEQPDPPT
jgi:hypothetical protein